MRAYIKKLQNKPEEHRKQILFVVMIVSMALVSSVWIYSLTDRFSSKNAEEISKDETKKPFELLTLSFKDAYKNMSASVANVSLLKEKKEEVPVTTQEILPTEKQIDLIIVDKK
jgi:hypothetical protein